MIGLPADGQQGNVCIYSFACTQVDYGFDVMG